MAQVPTFRLNDGSDIPQTGFGVFLIPPDEVVGAVLTALEAGYRLIDTASIYENEEGVGKAIAQSGIPLDELFITTKVWNDDQGYDQTLRAFDLSMKKLGLETIDLYLIHFPRPKLGRYVETWKAMERLRADGRVRSIGVSNFAPEQISRLLDEGEVAPTVNQVELHPGHPQAELRAFHAEHDIVTQAWSPIGRGQGLLAEPAVVEIAKELGRTPAQVVLRWHVQLGIVAIPKSVTPSRIRGNIQLFDFELSESAMAKISGLGASRVGPDPGTIYDLS